MLSCLLCRRFESLQPPLLPPLSNRENIHKKEKSRQSKRLFAFMLATKSRYFLSSCGKGVTGRTATAFFFFLFFFPLYTYSRLVCGKHSSIDQSFSQFSRFNLFSPSYFNHLHSGYRALSSGHRTSIKSSCLHFFRSSYLQLERHCSFSVWWTMAIY